MEEGHAEDHHHARPGHHHVNIKGEVAREATKLYKERVNQS